MRVAGLGLRLLGFGFLVEVGVSDVQTGALQVVAGRDDVVLVRGRQHVHGADAGSTVDRDRIVHVVDHDRVVVIAVVAFARVAFLVALALGAAAVAAAAGAAVVVAVAIGTLVRVVLAVVVRRHERVEQGVAGGRVDLDRRLEGEQVVARAAFEPQRRLVAVDEEGVVAGGAVRERGEVRTAAQPAHRRISGRELVLDRDVGHDARRLVGLAELEEGLAQPAVERRDRAVAVHEEVVVVRARDAAGLRGHVVSRGGAAVDGQAGVDVLVVVDPLHVLADQALDVAHRTVQQRDE